MRVGAGWIAVLCSVALLLPAFAAADPIAGSASQVGAWRVAAYTRGKTGIFDHCALYRVQSEGFALAVGYSPQGVWMMGAEAPDWGLAANESYTGTIQVGGAASYTFTGRASGPRIMAFNVAPEIFGQLKSGLQLTVAVNQKRYTISLDGVEAAAQRARECVRQYAAAAAAPASRQPPAQATGTSSVAPNQLVAAIQALLTRLGYDPGPANGEVGLKTNMAISAFQKSQGERGDGLPSEAVRAKLEKVVAERAATGAVKPKEKAMASAGTGFYISPDTSSPTSTWSMAAPNCVCTRTAPTRASSGSWRQAAPTISRRCVHETAGEEFPEDQGRRADQGGRAGAGVRLSAGGCAFLGRQHDARQRDRARRRA